jgi:predicted Zn-dependent protease
MSRFIRISDRTINFTDTHVEVAVDKEDGTVDVEVVRDGRDGVYACFTPTEAEQFIEDLQKAVAEFRR